MKKTILLLGLLLPFAALKAQSNTPTVLASGGNFYDAGSFSNSFTIGEMALVETFASSGFMLTQGFQQPNENPSGINSPENSFEFGIFPNPGNGIFYLEYNLDANAEITVEAYDMLGHLVLSEKSNRSNGHQLQTVDLTSEAEGIYFIRCTIKTANTNQVNTSKITITK